FWPRQPVILEHEHYGSSVRKEAWGDGSLLLKAVEEYHAGFLSIHWWPREFQQANREIIDKINLRLGYRLQLVEAAWPSEVDIDSRLYLASKWRNAGVAPCLPGGFPSVTLKDGDGGIVGVFVDDAFDVRSLPVGEPGKAKIIDQEANFALSRNLRGDWRPGIREPGTYTLFISIGTKTGTPGIALPLPENDGNRRYRLGTLKVTSGKTKSLSQ
ncbi:MAG: DUF4832 domain-containing protein, partial [Sedimentisphaerales bacterium]|nr:DUF4832 domain-containing protein [Sedimentisphaerales bacterium]